MLTMVSCCIDNAVPRIDCPLTCWLCHRMMHRPHPAVKRTLENAKFVTLVAQLQQVIVVRENPLEVQELLRTMLPVTVLAATIEEAVMLTSKCSGYN